MNDDDSITCNGGNVCTNADSQQVKARRVRCVDDAIRERDLSQREAAAVLDVVGPELSDIPSGRVRGCFAKRLLPILATLDREASIVAAEKSGDDALQQVEAKKRRAVPVFRDIAPLICSAPGGRRAVVAGQKIHYPLERRAFRVCMSTLAFVLLAQCAVQKDGDWIRGSGQASGNAAGATAASAGGPPRPIHCGAGPPAGHDTIVVSGDFGLKQYRPSKQPAGTVFDATNASFTVDNCGWGDQGIKGSSAKQAYPAILDGCVDCTWYGGVWDSKIPQDSEWHDSYCNSASLFAFRKSSNFTIDSVRIDGGWDAVRFTALDSSSVGTLENSWISNNRDDCVEDDNLESMNIRNTLFDGCFSGISAAMGGSAKQKFKPVSQNRIVLDGVLMRMQAYPWKGMRGNAPGVPSVFKWRANSPSLEIRNTVIALDHFLGNKPSSGGGWGGAMKNVTSCSNNYLLWMSDDPLPAAFENDKTHQCFTILTGDAARRKWQDRKNAWLGQCGR